MKPVKGTSKNMRRLIRERRPFTFGKWSWFTGRVRVGADGIERYEVRNSMFGTMFVYESGLWYVAAELLGKPCTKKRKDMDSKERLMEAMHHWLSVIRPRPDMAKRKQEDFKAMLKGDPKIAALIRVSAGP